MKYNPPSYESGLTAKVLVDSVDELVREHIIRKGTVKHDVYKLRQIGLDPGKLWHKPEIRRELEEFVKSYFFDNLGGLPEFAEIFAKEHSGEQRKLNLARYIGRLSQEHGAGYDSIGDVSGLLNELRRRGVHFLGELEKTKKVDGLMLIKGITRDAFGHLLIIYNRVELALDFIKLQS